MADGVTLGLLGVGPRDACAHHGIQGSRGLRVGGCKVDTECPGFCLEAVEDELSDILLDFDPGSALALTGRPSGSLAAAVHCYFP